MVGWGCCGRTARSAHRAPSVGAAVPRGPQKLFSLLNQTKSCAGAGLGGRGLGVFKRTRCGAARCGEALGLALGRRHIPTLCAARRSSDATNPSLFLCSLSLSHPLGRFLYPRNSVQRGAHCRVVHWNTGPCHGHRNWIRSSSNTPFDRHRAGFHSGGAGLNSRINGHFSVEE